MYKYINSRPHLAATLGNFTWMTLNCNQFKSVFPTDWTLITDLNIVQIGYALKLIGVDWQDPDELRACMLLCQRIGIIEMRDDLKIRINDFAITRAQLLGFKLMRFHIQHPRVKALHSIPVLGRIAHTVINFIITRGVPSVPPVNT
jgi:hypothetical protein